MLISVHSFAQKVCTGSIVDYITNRGLGDSCTVVEVLGTDSVVLDTADVQSSKATGRTTTEFFFVPPEDGNYILRCTNPNYETLYHPVSVFFHARESFLNLGKLKMKRIWTKELGDVVVKATKIKFYFNKDTLVYNADAFVTQDGFVLDDILRKMPGLAFKDGEIFSNGRKIDALLLNGKDFFNSDRQTMLENLPAYMIKKVLVYDKTKDSTSVFERERQFEGLVMDIKLKRDYHSSLLGSVDAGAGTDNRYFGRLFAMKFNDVMRLSAFVGSNNVGKNEQMQENGSFSNIDRGIGEKKFNVAGLNYNVDEREGKYSMSGFVRAQTSSELQISESTSQQFFAEGDVFNATVQRSKAKNYSIQSGHQLTLLQNTPWIFYLRPSFVYIHSDENFASNYLSANKNIVNELGHFWKDSIAAPQLSERMQAIGINRMINRYKTPSNQSQLSLSIDKRIAIPHTTDHVALSMSGIYLHSGTSKYNQYSMDYIQLPDTKPLWQNQYQRIFNDNWQWKTSAAYYLSLSEHHRIDATFNYEHHRTNSNDTYYQLHLLEGWGFENPRELGEIPLKEALDSIIDGGNSKRYVEHRNKYLVRLKYLFEHDVYSFSVNATYNYEHNNLRFFQSGNNSSVERSFHYPYISAVFSKSLKRNTGWRYEFSIGSFQNMPELINMVKQFNDANKMMVYEGNPNLKSSSTYYASVGLSWIPKVMHHHDLKIEYNQVKDPFSQAFKYDKKTGVYTYTPVNVDAAHSFNSSLKNSIFLPGRGQHKLENELRFTYYHSKSISGVNAEEFENQYSLHESWLSERFTYGISSTNTKYRFEISPCYDWRYNSSDRPNFTHFNISNLSVRLSGHIEFPWSVRLNTELSGEKRFGYIYDEMNEARMIWNMSIAKSFNNSITVSLEAFDILNQRKNLYPSFTGQMRTETIRNMLRRYVMLHFIWQFSKKK